MTSKTRVIKKHTGAIHIHNRLSLLQRKISNVLLYYAYNSLLEKDIHEIQLKDLADEVGFNSNDIELLKDSLRKLVTVKIEWNILDEKNKEEWGVCSSLSEAIIKDGTCKYAYPHILRERLFHPTYYAKISLHMQRRINGNYALALYENLVRYKKVGTTDWIELQKFKELMGADNVKSYEQYKDLNKYVIKPAIKEINRVTDIIVELSKTKRSGRQIKYLKFSIQEKKQLTLPFSFNEDDKVLNQLSKRLMKLGLKREKVDEILTRHEIDYINKHLNFIENEIKKNKIKSSAAGLFLSALKDDYSVNFNSKSTKDNFSKNHSKFEIRPGIKVLYDNQRFDIVGELGKEYIEFHRGVKMNRDTILDYLTNGQMFIDSDLQKAVN